MRLWLDPVEQEAGLPRNAGILLAKPDRRRIAVTSDRYSRRVTLLKRLLPAIGVTLLLLVAGWTRIAPLLENAGLRFPAIDLREARELRMVNPRYGGLDRYNRPYVVTAAIGRQVPDRNDVMGLERPKAVMTIHGGASIVLTAKTGIYQSQAQLLDLFGDVNLVHEDGTRFVTQRAHLNLSDNTASGRDPIEGHGPSGDITGEGFQVLSKGETITFNGTSFLLLKGIKATSTPADPPALPAAVENAAAMVEVAAAALSVAPSTPPPQPGRLTTTARGRPVVTSRHSAKAQPSAEHAGRNPAHNERPAIKASHLGG
jgi:lipopolysaccharide export system protein LptC